MSAQVLANTQYSINSATSERISIIHRWQVALPRRRQTECVLQLHACRTAAVMQSAE